MPDEANTPKRRVSQAPVKLATCYGGCGATVEIRTNPRVYCPVCKVARKLASARVAMEKQRRKRGIAQVKGTLIPCVDCGKPFERNRCTRAKYCPACGPLHYAAKARRSSREKRATEAGRIQINTWTRERKKTDINFHLASKLRARINMALRRALVAPSQKAAKTIDLLGCTFEQFKAHIERQFTKGMTWQGCFNGEIHLDHRRPCASFDLTDPAQQRECFHYLNIQPLWAVDNLAKNAKRTLLL